MDKFGCQLQTATPIRSKSLLVRGHVCQLHLLQVVGEGDTCLLNLLLSVVFGVKSHFCQEFKEILAEGNDLLTELALNTKVRFLKNLQAASFVEQATARLQRNPAL